MAKKPIPTPTELRKLLDYDPVSGLFVWRERPLASFASDGVGRSWNTRYAGRTAGSPNDKGYIYIKIDGVLYHAHRIAWAMHHGEWPGDFIDHVDHDRANNAIENLRVVTRSENQKNQRPRRAGEIIGVRFREKFGHWIAQIGVDGKSYHLGAFKSRSRAIEARKAAEVKFGFHRNHGKNLQGES